MYGKNPKTFFDETKIRVSLTLPILKVETVMPKVDWSGWCEMGLAQPMIELWFTIGHTKWCDPPVHWHHFDPFWLMNLEKSWNILKNLETLPVPSTFIWRAWLAAATLKFFVPSTYVAQSSVNDWARGAASFSNPRCFSNFSSFLLQKVVFFPMSICWGTVLWCVK